MDLKPQDSALGDLPLVTVIVPCYNEAGRIRFLLEAIDRLDYPHEKMEIIIADGRSTDSTRQEIAAFQAKTPTINIRVIDNEKRTIPAGLNRAIEEATGEIIVRLDAHSMPYPDYVSRCVTWLSHNPGPFNVGGCWEIQPSVQTAVGRGIAAAAAHPLGAGDALYRLAASEPRQVETVPFGAFRREMISKVGGFDESLLTNEDYEFNVRVQRSGGAVWLDPGIRSVYFARPTLAALARQYWRYGWWKARMLRRYPSTLRWRQLLPPVFVLGLAGLLISGIIYTPAWWLLIAVAAVYLLVLLAAGLKAATAKHDLGLLLNLPAAIVVMHLSWGMGFLISFAISLLRIGAQESARIPYNLVTL